MTLLKLLRCYGENTFWNIANTSSFSKLINVINTLETKLHDKKLLEQYD